MRDVIVALIVFGALPIILMRPHIGIYVWSWIGYMNPHRLGWGFAYNFPFAALIGGVTLIAILFSKEPKRIPWNALTVSWILFMVWISVTSLFAQSPEMAWVKWEKFMKIQLMILITLMLINNRERLHVLVWTIVASMGFYGVKGGIFTLATGGNYMVWGPAGSFVEGNNEMAFALIIILPLMRYLQLQADNKWIRRGLLLAMLLTSFSILASYSRGAFLALAAIAVFLWLKSNKKMLIGGVILLLVPIMLAFMPKEWTERMGTIQEYDEDESAMGRIYIWKIATLGALDSPFVGRGFGTFATRDIHSQYQSEVTDNPDIYIATDAHSIYFLILGEHGFVGLSLFLLLLYFGFRTGAWVIKHTKSNDELKWAGDLAAMCQVSLIGYSVGGAFLGLAYFDLYYHLISIIILLKAYVQKQQSAPNTKPLTADTNTPKNAPQDNKAYET